MSTNASTGVSESNSNPGANDLGSLSFAMNRVPSPSAPKHLMMLSVMVSHALSIEEFRFLNAATRSFDSCRFSTCTMLLKSAYNVCAFFSSRLSFCCCSSCVCFCCLSWACTCRSSSCVCFCCLSWACTCRSSSSSPVFGFCVVSSG